MDGADTALFERGLRHATANHSGAALDGALEELGWPEALATDPRAAVTLLFELMGRTGATSSALEQIFVTTLGEGTGAATGVVLPLLGGADPPGQMAGQRVEVRGLATTALPDRARSLIVARRGDEHLAVTVEAAALSRRPVGGLDPELGLVEVVGAHDAVRAVATAEDAHWADALALGRLALGHQLVGAARHMLELACRHAVARVQFGRPIASFQAVRHRLADVVVAVDGAAALLDAAWDDRSPVNAAMAKASAGRAARTAASHCQQVLAGIGFTTEHPFHRYVRRNLVLDQLLGSASSLTRQLGREILLQRRLPPPVPLSTAAGAAEPEPPAGDAGPD